MTLRASFARLAARYRLRAEAARIEGEALGGAERGAQPAAAARARRVAFTWELLALRVAATDERRARQWLLQHLEGQAADPVVGACYAAARADMVALLAAPASAHGEVRARPDTKARANRSRGMEVP